MITEGLKIMAVGMGVVFFVLTMLTLTTILTSKIISALNLNQKDSSQDTPSQGRKKHLPAIIAAAIEAFREDK